MDIFAEQDFKRKLDRAVERVRVVLSDVKHPCLSAHAVHHRYQDKYVLAECGTNAASASQTNCLLCIGVTPVLARQLHAWAQGSAVSLSFRSTETCVFEREEAKEVEGPKVVEESSVMGRAAVMHTTKVVTQVKEYFWRFEVSHELLALRAAGANSEDRVRICGRSGSGIFKTLQKSPPYPANRRWVWDVNISWLLRNLQSDASAPQFCINREHPQCRTPRRNTDIEAAITHFSTFASWASDVSAYLGKLASVDAQLVGGNFGQDVKVSALVGGIFMPVLPLLQDAASLADVALARGAEDAEVAEGPAAHPVPEGSVVLRAGSREGSAVIGITEVNRLLAEEQRCLRDKLEMVSRQFPADALFTSAEAFLLIVLKHCIAVCTQHHEALEYIESMLREQLIVAIGKEVSPVDFTGHMSFHNRKLFADAYAPVPFSFSVRRSAAHTPEGTVSIEQTMHGSAAELISTLVARSGRPHPMRFSLSAAANVSFGGDHYVHAWLSHQFSGSHAPNLSLVARARQFSSMIVLVGRIASVDLFEPKYAAIVRDKDELTIPLDLSTIPTPKEFKDAIESLSPEQQRFAKAFRAMQLESTLFGVVVIQLRPQLEKVLNLPDNALTKDIKLTQDLMDLFITHQIPSDLLSFDGDPDVPGPQRVEAVRGHVAAIRAVVDKAKAQEVQDARQTRDFQFAGEPLQNGGMDLLGDFDMMGGMMGGMSSALPPMGGMGGTSGGLDLLGGFGGMGGMCGDFYDGGDGSYRSMGGIGGMGGMEGMGDMGSFYRDGDSPRRGISMGGVGGGVADFAMPDFSAPPPPQMSDFSALDSLFSSESTAAATAQAAEPPPVPPAAASLPASADQLGSSLPNPVSDGAQDWADQRAEYAGSGDYTQMPIEMDKRFAQFDDDNALRPTIISVADSWTKRSQQSLLASPVSSTLGGDSLKREKDAAFDLLDALTKSGALPMEHASLHVMIAATHLFDKTVTETVVQGNVNPIEKVERSLLIMGATVHGKPASALIRDAQRDRMRAASPKLFLAERGM